MADVADVLIHDDFVTAAAGAQRINKIIHQRCDCTDVVWEVCCKGLLIIRLPVLACRSINAVEPGEQSVNRHLHVLEGHAHSRATFSMQSQLQRPRSLTWHDDCVMVFEVCGNFASNIISCKSLCKLCTLQTLAQQMQHHQVGED